MATDTITALGAGSGVDIKALAKSLTDAEGTPAKDAIKKKISKSNANISGYAAIKFVASNLSAAFTALKNESSFNSITPGNSQPAALSVVAGAKAATGSHSVSVTTLAAAQRNTSAGFATAGTALNGGAAFKLWLAVNGAPAKSIAVSAATPEGVVVAINQAALGVSAQLVNTGDATAPFKLMVSGTTGVANDFTLKSDNDSSGITVTTTQGETAVNETSSLAFGTALTAGQTITVGGLTYTSTGATSTAQLAAAFASLANGATTGPATATGSYSGKLSGFATGAATGSTLSAKSVTSSNVTFTTDVTAGQSVTIGALTYTPTGAATKEQIAAAFASLSAGATTGPSAHLGTYTGTLAGFSTGVATNATVIADTPTTGNVSDIQTLGAGVTGLDFGTVLQNAANAALTVNGVAVTSSTNSIQGAISGATLNLSTVTTTPATLNFSRDTTSVKAKLQALVTSYNDAISMLNVVSDPKSTVETYGATLVGNSTALQVRNQLRALVLGNSSSPAANITALRDIGISVDRTGVLQLDTAKVDAALNTNFDNVVTMLSANRENQSTASTLSAGVAGDAVKKLTALIDTTGPLTTQSTNATAKITASNKELAKLETRLAVILARYSKQLTAMDSIVGQTNSMRTGLTATFDGMMAAYTNK